MNAILVKEKEHFFLKMKDANGNTMIVANTFEPIIQLANFGGLSIKNCKAIERGYDLDELFDEEVSKSKSDDYYECCHNSFVKGFQKCLEILGDREFTDEDLYDAFLHGKHRGSDEYQNRETGSLEFHEYIKKYPPQTEWEVEIVTEQMNIDEIREQGKGFLNANTQKPKLDANGKLILKRI
jgi:hypothetical protein